MLGWQQHVLRGTPEVAGTCWALPSNSHCVTIAAAGQGKAAMTGMQSLWAVAQDSPRACSSLVSCAHPARGGEGVKRVGWPAGCWPWPPELSCPSMSPGWPLEGLSGLLGSILLGRKEKGSVGHGVDRPPAPAPRLWLRP